MDLDPRNSSSRHGPGNGRGTWKSVDNGSGYMKCRRRIPGLNDHWGDWHVSECWNEPVRVDPTGGGQRVETESLEWEINWEPHFTCHQAYQDPSPWFVESAGQQPAKTDPALGETEVGKEHQQQQPPLQQKSQKKRHTISQKAKAKKRKAAANQKMVGNVMEDESWATPRSSYVQDLGNDHTSTMNWDNISDMHDQRSSKSAAFDQSETAKPPNTMSNPGHHPQSATTMTLPLSRGGNDMIHSKERLGWLSRWLSRPLPLPDASLSAVSQDTMTLDAANDTAQTIGLYVSSSTAAAIGLASLRAMRKAATASEEMARSSHISSRAATRSAKAAEDAIALAKEQQNLLQVKVLQDGISESSGGGNYTYGNSKAGTGQLCTPLGSSRIGCRDRMCSDEKEVCLPKWSLNIMLLSDCLQKNELNPRFTSNGMITKPQPGEEGTSEVQKQGKKTDRPSLSRQPSNMHNQDVASYRSCKDILERRRERARTTGTRKEYLDRYREDKAYMTSDYTSISAKGDQKGYIL